jgi:hypothetical protein
MRDESSNPELARKVLQTLEEKFSGQDRDEAAKVLREFHWELRPEIDERIHLDIIHAAENLSRLRSLVELAKKDWRDLIVTAEYESKNGKLVQSEWSKEMARNREVSSRSGKSRHTENG